MNRSTLLLLVFLTGFAAHACDADVLRINYRRTSTTKPASAPATAPAKTIGTSLSTAPPTAHLTPSTKLEPR